jgi:acetyl-CoA carboxylase biotin carboxyl carrier protein
MSKTSSPAPKPAGAASESQKSPASESQKSASSQGQKPAASQSANIDAALVREIANMLSESDLTEIEVEKGDLRIRVARQATMVAPAPAYAPAYAPAPVAAAPVGTPMDSLAPAEAHAAADVLKSPMVGTAYLRPSPDAKAFIEIGTHVIAGQKVLLVEAMKTFNDIVAHKNGAITAILIEDGQPVEYGQPLLVIA